MLYELLFDGFRECKKVRFYWNRENGDWRLDVSPNDILGFYEGEILPELKNILIKMNTEQQRKIISMIRLMNP